MKASKLSYIIVAALLFSNAFGSTQLLPVDEGTRDLEFMAFRSKLLEAVTRKEPESFVTMINPRIFNGLQTKRGMKQFMKIWEPESIDSQVWITLEPILKMGGGFIRSERGVEFCAPYTFSHFPDDLNIYAHGVVINDDVPLKASPTVSANTIKKLSFDLIQVIDWISIDDASGGTPSWLRVTTMTGDKGYVDRHFVRSPSDYSACFVRTKYTGWKLDSLLINE